MERKELCSCCKQEGDFGEHWHFKVPDVGYGSRFDYITPDEQVEFTICRDCLEAINNWLIRKYPRINLVDFWHFAIIDKSAEQSLPTGYLKELKYDKELFTMLMRFMPEAYFREAHVTFLKKLIYRIKFAPFFYRH